MQPPSKKESIGLADLIQQVRSELIQSVEGSGSDVPLFAVDEVELEIGVTIAKRAEGGLDIKVVQLGASGERSDVHRVSVRLLPLLTLEERRAELRKKNQWAELVRTQMDATLKSVSASRSTDTPSRQPRDLA
jgi:hypothetical protein